MTRIHVDLLKVNRSKKAIKKVAQAVLAIGDYENLVTSDFLVQDGLIKSIELVGEYVYKT